MSRKLHCFFIVIILGLQGCAGTAQLRKPVSVSPGQVFVGSYINVTAPNSEGWQLIESSGNGMVFAKGNQAARESFVAYIKMFNLAPTNTPQEFEALIKTSVEKDSDPTRFDIQQTSFKYSDEARLSMCALSLCSARQDTARAKGSLTA